MIASAPGIPSSHQRRKPPKNRTPKIFYHPPCSTHTLSTLEGSEESLSGVDQRLLLSTKLDLSLGTTGLGDEFDTFRGLGVWNGRGRVNGVEQKRRKGRDEQGLRRKRTARFLRGFFFWEKGRLVMGAPAARTTDWISSELMIRVTSGLVIFEMGRLRERK